ncbi:hypothetical protein EI427_18065 [Flammeovirga pectinis]|uniref:Ava_C0101 and related proteins n=1 Tax=Flammeovirga pectinis TaxID=2494373 RepID=A0A3Q9FNA0_9BACT|nr:DUF5996 family protein [Flammeovirga pectinis]AZQ64064.1 hypothetical protein EI427_18065 [Flammeovirga pectinis]
MASEKKQNQWPVLNFNDIKDTLATLHQWIQIVGKIRLKTMPWQNHSWHTTLYVSPHGYTTQSIPYQGKIFQIDFDFEQHKLFIECTGKTTVSFDLKPMTVAKFYTLLFEELNKLGIDVTIHGSPNELEVAIPFKENTTNKSYDAKVANTLWRTMVKVNSVFTDFRSDFIGKCSPVHLFWGAFDLAVTRFSGKDAPLHQGQMPNMPQKVMQEAYSKEVSSAGFWPGSEAFPSPAFYAYAYPSAPTFGEQKVLPNKAFYSTEMGEFFLKYEDVIKAENPEEMLYTFLQTTYEAAANTANWERTELERVKSE